MVMLGEPLAGAITAARQRQASSGVKKSRVVYLSPQGKLLTHPVVKGLVSQQDEGLILLAGRYEGVDERLIRQYVDEEISIGDYVLSGGELAAMVLIDSLVRQLPGVLGDADSIRGKCHQAGGYEKQDHPCGLEFGLLGGSLKRRSDDI